jgi:hypothetical protein
MISRYSSIFQPGQLIKSNCKTKGGRDAYVLKQIYLID